MDRKQLYTCIRKFNSKILFGKICRACTRQVNEVCKIENDPLKPELYLLVKRYIPEFAIKIENAVLCKDCVTALYNFHEFKRKCLRTEEDLRLHIRKNPDVKTVDLSEVFAHKGNRIRFPLTTPNKRKRVELPSGSADKNIPKVISRRFIETKRPPQRDKRAFLDNRINQCTKCSRRFFAKSKMYYDHLAYHETPHADRFKCTICDFVYHDKSALTQHNASKHPSDDQSETTDPAYFECEFCPEKFLGKTSLNEHLRVHKREILLKNSAEKSATTGDPIPETAANPTSEAAANPTSETAANPTSETAANPTSETAANPTSDTEVTTRKICDICHRGFPSQRTLGFHKRTYHVRERYNCHKCARNFALKTAYSAHLVYHETARAGRYICEECNFVYQSWDALNKHNLSKHSSDDKKPFQCEVCEMRFVDKSALTVHMRTHTGEKPYQCPFCAHATATLGAIYKHTSQKHNVEVERRFNRGKSVFIEKA